MWREEGGRKQAGCVCNTNIFFFPAPLARCILKHFFLFLSLCGRYISDGVLYSKLTGRFFWYVWSLEVRQESMYSEEE